MKYSLVNDKNIEIVDLDDNSIPLVVYLLSHIEKLTGIHIGLYKEE